MLKDFYVHFLKIKKLTLHFSSFQIEVKSISNECHFCLNRVANNLNDHNTINVSDEMKL